MTRVHTALHRDRSAASDTGAADHCETIHPLSEAITRAPLRGGRPMALTAAALLDYYQQHATASRDGTTVAWTRSEVARQLRVSAETIARREADLITAGAIRREICPDRQRSHVILLSVGSDVNAHASGLPIGT